MRLPRSLRWRGLVFGLLMVAARSSADAQWRTSLTIAGWPLTATTTDGAAFEAGGVLLGTTTFTVDATSNLIFFPNRATTVDVRCVPACPRSGTLPLAGVQWRRSDQVSWTSLTTTFVTVESRTLTYNGVNDPWSQSMQWRYALSWTANPPTAASQFRIEYRLTVAAP